MATVAVELVVVGGGSVVATAPMAAAAVETLGRG